jgi:small-conductance mechanosensitive channel
MIFQIMQFVCSPAGEPTVKHGRPSTRKSAVVRFSILACALIIFGRGVGVSQAAPTKATEASDIIQFLSRTIDWHRQWNTELQIAIEPSYVLVVNDDRRLADRIVQLAFDFARAEAQIISKPSSQSANPSAESPQYQSLMQLSAKLDNQVRELQSELESLRRKLESARGPQRQLLESTVAEVQSELDLANVRRDTLRSMADFVSGASTGGLGATGLRAQIEALARSVPADISQSSSGTQNQSSSTQPSNVAASAANKTEPSGIWGRTGNLLALSRKIHTIDQRIQNTDDLTEKGKELRAPLISQLKQLSQQGDVLAQQADTADPNALAQEKKELDALTAQFRQTSAAVLPLSKQGVLLGLYKTSLTNWRNNVKAEYRAELRSLLLRLAILAIVLAFVFGIAELWRKTIFRYVHEPRRRYQFLLLRKIVLWFLIGVIIAFSFATQLGSVATFAGLLTAGVAVALQNVILSIVGYFFLIGRFGIRVGDRVQIEDVNGEVLDIGLARLHLMELSGSSGTPTGRVVAFSNSIVFQPTAGLFKQIPGTSFVWHEITITLSPDSDYHMVEKRLLEVVETVFADYRDDIEKQRRQLERTLSYGQTDALRPRSRLRITQSGLEAVIHFPVTLQNAAEIDDRVTRELLQAINREPKLKLVGSGTPSIRLDRDLSASSVSR